MVTVHIKVEDRALADKIRGQNIPNLSWLCDFVDMTVATPTYRSSQFASNDMSAIYTALYIIEEWYDKEHIERG